MDPPAEGIELKPEKLEEEKDGRPLFHCDFCDADIVDKVAQSFLPGLASACIDNTTGGLFKTPANVAVEIRKEMVEYLIQRSENFVAESVVLEGGADVEVSVDPFDVISDFVDDFVHSKRNFFSRVSGWLMSEKREDWIDDLVQEMELNGFWLLNRRLAVAQTLLKNLDFKNTYHCKMNFRSPEDLERHKLNCGFRTMSCTNEGCDSSFSAVQMDQHDSVCPFKMLPCEQQCSDIIMRRDMDRHCITTCPMKLVKCPFHSVGCQSTVPQRTIEQHRSENLDSHLLCVLQVIHKEASPEVLKGRVQELLKKASPGRLVSARDARSLTYVVKDLEAKLGPLKANTDAQIDNEVKPLVDEKEKTETQAKQVKFEEKNSVANEEKATSMPVKQVRFEEAAATSDSEDSDDGKGEMTASSAHDHEDSPRKKREPVDSSVDTSTNEEEVVALIPAQEENAEDSLAKLDEQMEKSSEEDVVSPMKEEHSTPTIQQEVQTDSITEPTANNEVFNESPTEEISSSIPTMAKNEEEEEEDEEEELDVVDESALVKEEMEPLTQQN